MDDLLLFAANIVTTGSRHGSPSRLMRQLRQGHGIAVTFAGAQHLLHRLETAGVVGPVNDWTHAHPVLMDREQAMASLGVKR
jgi:hypothetical protein